MMESEQKVLNLIMERFPVLEGRVHVVQKQRIMVDPLTRRDFDKILAFLVNEAGFNKFHMVYGVDNGKRMGFHCVLSNSDHILLTLKQLVAKEEAEITSLCERFPSALLQEQEMMSLFGVSIEGIPAISSFPLPENWLNEGYPLRKEWNPSCFDRNKMNYHKTDDTDTRR